MRKKSKHILAALIASLFISGYFYTKKSENTFSLNELSGTVESPDEKIESEYIVNQEVEEMPEEILLDVPLLNQMNSPRLYNGCEVTSLAMILNFKGIDVSKNELADAVNRVPMQYSNGQYGNPNTGFVGNMEDGPGLGVYHEPLFQLAQQYADGVDLTGQPFEVLLKQVAGGNPVWIITTSTFAPVSEFQTWQTPEGPVDITYNMHSVVITGYDAENIYINNPYGTKNQKVDKENFILAWEQMGKQAIVIN
nr:C39 family peptidase [Neobacillus sp. Marseille-Q6967]